MVLEFITVMFNFITIYRKEETHDLSKAKHALIQHQQRVITSIDEEDMQHTRFEMQ